MSARAHRVNATTIVIQDDSPDIMDAVLSGMEAEGVAVTSEAEHYEPEDDDEWEDDDEETDVENQFVFNQQFPFDENEDVLLIPTLNFGPEADHEGECRCSNCEKAARKERKATHNAASRQQAYYDDDVLGPTPPLF